jgi:hypothetical protein
MIRTFGLCGMVVILSVCGTAFAQDPSVLDARQQKTAIESDLARAKGALAECKLGEARTFLEGADQKMEQSKAVLAKADAAALRPKIDKLKKSLAFKEDSLVNCNIALLRSKGADSAFQFMQTVVWARGVSKDKIDIIENTIMSEAPILPPSQPAEVAPAAPEPAKPAAAPLDLTSAPPTVNPTPLPPPEEKPAAPAPLPVVNEPLPPPVVAEKPAVALTPEPAPVIATKPVVPETAPLPAAPVKQPEQTPPPPPVTPAPSPIAAPAVVPPPPAPAATAPAKPVAEVKKNEDYLSPALQAVIKSKEEFLQKLKGTQESAKQTIVDLYTMIEAGQGRQAMTKFKNERAFLAKYVDPQAFNALEMTVAQAAIESPGADSDAAASQSAAPVAAAKPVPPEQGYIDRINALERDNRVEAAYKEFKRVESRLQQFMPSKEFKLLKDMVENSYKLRTGSSEAKGTKTKGK